MYEDNGDVCNHILHYRADIEVKMIVEHNFIFST